MNLSCIGGGGSAARVVVVFVVLCQAFAAWRGSAQSSNGVLREVYANIGGTTIPDLTNSPSYPNSPTLESIEPNFEAPVDWGENYGQRLRALLLPPVTGAYTFYIAGDDNSELWLSSDESPAHKQRIARVATWTASRVWQETRDGNNVVQKSAPILLTNGVRYYVEALQKEGGGGDNLAVAWQKPGDPVPANGSAPILSSNLLVFGLGPPIITVQPTNATAIEGGYASFVVALQRMIGAAFQWQANGTNIPGATNPVLALGPLSLADSGGRFQCGIVNSLGSTNTQEAVLTVLPDTTRPGVLTVGSLGDPTVVFVVFSEGVEPATATNTGSYSISGGVEVLRAVFGLDGRTVILTTTPMLVNSNYTLTVSNVRDLASTPNTMLPAQLNFSLTVRPIDVGYLGLPKEPLGPSTRRHGVVISEVMYHPTNRTDGRNLEYIEIYNAQPWFEELGGWRISGAVDYVFPSNTVLAARSFLVVAANPADFRAVYSFANVYGPFANSNGLQNSSGTLRLRNGRDAIVFEMEYSGDPPFPAAADGGGPSLVLARASYGERDPRAWAASDFAGGSPGAADAFTVNSLRPLIINEFLAHTDPPQLDYIELFNAGNGSLNIGGCLLTDDPETNKFAVPAGTTLAPRSFIVFSEEQLGFSLSSGGETLWLKHPSGRAVLDAVRFQAQENGVATGRYPDGAPGFRRLVDPTPGTNNAPAKVSEVAINEIMYDPVSDDAQDEYVELYNWGTNAVNLSGWRLRGGISFNFPAGTMLDAGGYLVVAKNAARLRSSYPNLTAANCLGDFGGSLANSGERLELNKPDEVIDVNSSGQVRTNLIHIPVEEVTYGTGGRWGGWSGGGGSSLELRDPRADHRLAPNWGDSDESGKSQWVTVEATGVMDNGWAAASQLHVTLLGAGEALVDEVEVIPFGGTNVIGNGTFEKGVAGWVFQGNHNETGWEPKEGYNSGGSLHLRALGRGDSGANRVRAQLAYELAANTRVTLRAKVRWLKGTPNVLLRLRGNWMEAPGYILTARNLGTPGAPNSQAVANAGPAITEVRHYPALPAAGQQVLVTAQVQDPDGLSFLALNYRIDPSTNYLVLAMTNNGSGLYSAVLPAQAAGVAAGFFLRASDNFAIPAASAFPSDAPAREAVVRWGDNAIPGTLPTYRFWLTQTNVNRWVAEEKMSNKPKDITFIYGTNRVIYNAGAWFHGSPYHSPSYNSPVGASCDYDLGFPKDDPLLGETDINLFRPGNGGGDGTGQGEIQANWFGGQFGLPYLYHRPVFVYVNGQRRETVFHDAQQPNGDFVEQWYPDDADGDLHKVQLGFEFGDMASGASEAGYAVVAANLGRYVTTGGVKKQARYRATWPRRSSAPQELNDYTNIFNLVEVALTNAPIGSDAYTVAQMSAVDVEEWFKVHVTQHLYNNYDSFSYGGGQNAFAYKPQRDRWQLLLWDVDFAFGGPANDANISGIGGADHGPRNNHPPFTRIYWQALIEAANGMMTAARANPILDARYTGLTSGGAAVASPQAIKDFIAARRTFILGQIASNQAPFTVRGLTDFTTNRNLITLSGTAPLEARSILINGLAYPLTWTSLSNWVIRVPLHSGSNTLVLTAVDPKGTPLPAISGTVRVNYTGADERPQDKLVINEIMYHPLVADASYVEIYNTSSSNVFDLTGWKLNGVDFTFPNGALIEPGAYKLVVKEPTIFAETYGPSSAIVGQFNGNLDQGGETLTLLQPGGGVEPDGVIDQVTFDDGLPWPAAADGSGSSLQLIDALQDNNRSANWGAASNGVRFTPGFANSLRATLPAFPSLWLNEVLPDNFFLGTNGVADGFGERDPWVELYNGGTNTLSLAGYYLSSAYTNLTQWAFPPGASIGPKQFVLVWLDGQTNQSTAAEWHASFRATPGVGSIVLSRGTNLASVIDHLNYTVPVLGRSYGSYPDGAVSGRRTFSTVTPGGTNNPASAPIEVRINEWMADNLRAVYDPADLDAEDWFELYNPGTNVVDLTGCFLSDSLTNTTQWPVPAGTLIEPGGYLVVWADGEPGQNSAARPDLHAGFSLAKGGEAIALFAADGTVIDAVTFLAQTTDVSEGRYPDGAATIVALTNATPGSANVLVTENTPPSLGSLPDRVVDEGALLSFTATAIDTNVPAQALTFALVGPVPPGATLDPVSGLFRWVPGEDQGPGVYPLALRVSDSGVPSLSATQTFIVTVNEVNNAPILAPLLSRTVNEGELLAITNSATDPDPGVHALSFSLDPGAPAGMNITPEGRITWTPTEAQGPGTYTATVRVTDDGDPALSDAQTLTVFVVEVNTPPELAAIADRTVEVGQPLSITLSAVDGDLPVQNLTFSLEAGPPGAGLDPNSGDFVWTPALSENGTTNQFTVMVSDHGSPALTATRSFSVYVMPELRATVSRNGQGVSITFSSTPGRTYRVEYLDQLGAGDWTALGPDVAATGPATTVSDASTVGQQRFYRVMQVP